MELLHGIASAGRYSYCGDFQAFSLVLWDTISEPHGLVWGLCATAELAKDLEQNGNPKRTEY